MNEFNLQNWQAALSEVFALAAIDPAYRRLCLNNPHEAVRKVSEIELPHNFRFEFVADSRNIFSSFLLPPLLAPVPPERLKETKQEVKELTDWYVTGYPYNDPGMMHTIGGGGTHGGQGVSGGGSGSGTGGG